MENNIARYLLQKEPEAIKFWRTSSGAEVDFIYEKADEIIPIEVKFSTFKEPKISRGFRSFLITYKPPRAVVFTRDFWGGMDVDGVKVKFVSCVYV